MLKKIQVYDWGEEQQSSFESIKSSILVNCLGYFDVDRRTEIWVDAGPNGVAAYVIQCELNGKNRTLITCGSHAFSAAEKNYSQVEISGLSQLKVHAITIFKNPFVFMGCMHLNVNFHI